MARWQRRDAKRTAEKRRMKKHGKSMAAIYAAAVTKK